MTIAKRVFIIAPETPWPANHGARVDVWNRYEGLRELGWEMHLAFWAEFDAVANNVSVELERVFSSVQALPLERDLLAKSKRLVRMIKYPSLVALRHVPEDVYAVLLTRVRKLGPSAIISEFIYGSILAKRLADDLQVPLFIRSHNIEHHYMLVQQSLSKHWKQWLQITAARHNLEAFETSALKSAWSILDISETDAQFWRSRGVKRVNWCPSIFPGLEVRTESQRAWEDREFDIGYLGNLWTPNNVSALEWFFDEILPLVRARNSGVRVLIAGSKASADFEQRISTTPNVTYLPSPPDAAAVRANVRVLINPIRKGSGINTKSVEMLFADSPVVTTSFAINGMSATVSGAFLVSDEPSGFAGHILEALHHPYRPNEARFGARHLFGRGGAEALAATLLSEIAEFHSYHIRKARG